MFKIFKEFIKEEKGQTMVEWIVILALILVVIIGVLSQIGKSAKNKGDQIKEALES